MYFDARQNSALCAVDKKMCVRDLGRKEFTPALNGKPPLISSTCTHLVAFLWEDSELIEFSSYC